MNGVTREVAGLRGFGKQLAQAKEKRRRRRKEREKSLLELG